jgi:S-DNA-T family DNA segregation ATPase FtsK/SpoIIIE
VSARHWFDARPAREASVILLAGLTLLLAISLATYSPHDPSLLVSSAAPPQNWVGHAGANAAALLFEGFGLAAWFAPAIVLAATVRRWRGRRDTLRRSALLGLVLVGLATATLLALLVGAIGFHGAPLQAGGALGELAARGLVAAFSEVGSLVLTLVVLGVGLALVSRSSLSESTAGLLRAGAERAPALRELLARVGRGIAGAARALRPRRVADAFWPLVPLRVRRLLRGRRAAKPTLAPLAMLDPADVELPAPEPPPDPPAPAPAPKTKKVRRAPSRRPRQAVLPVDLPPGGAATKLPPVELLGSPPVREPISQKDLLATARHIEERCAEFSVEGQVREFHPGPVVTTFEFRPSAGIKLSRITSLTDDLALALEAENVRIDRLPGRSSVGVEVPNRQRQTILLREVIDSDTFRRHTDLLTLGLGKTQDGEIFCAPLSKMPHLLIAGSTGSGKSVGLNAIIGSILFRARPDQVKFILVDPKMLELGLYEGLPHLLVPVVTDMQRAGNGLKWAVREMERRYRLLASCNVRHLDSYNRLVQRSPETVEQAIEGIPPRNGEKFDAEPLPYVVIVVDELADMLMTTGQDVEEAIARLAQKARAVGIHLILATQRPSVDVLTGAIKANFPARIAFRVASKIDSRTILDASGAERLLGAGDMLYRHPSSSRLLRVHGAWISEEESLRLVEWLKGQARAEYDKSVLEDPPEATGDGGAGLAGDAEDPLYRQAARLVITAGQGSTSFLQRRMKLGYSRAARIVDQLEDNGILGPADGSKPRQVLVGHEFLERMDEQDRDR